MSRNNPEATPQVEVEFGLSPDDSSPELYARVIDQNPVFGLFAVSREGTKDAHLTATVEGDPVLAIVGSRTVEEVRAFRSNPEMRTAEVAILRGLGAVAQKQGITKVSGFVSSPSELDVYKEALGEEPFRFVDAVAEEVLPLSYDEARESLDRHNQRIENGTAADPVEPGMFIGVDISGFQPKETESQVIIKNEFELLDPPSWDEFYAKYYPDRD